MKAIKLLSMVLALGVVTASLTACGEKEETLPPTQNQEQNQEVIPQPGEEDLDVNPEESEEALPEENEQIANPVQSFDTVEDAVAYVGHLNPLPQIYERYNKDATVINDTLIQIVYQNDSGEVLTLREQAGTDADISGNYNGYAFEDTFQYNDIDVSIKGGSGDSINLVTWNDGAYSHSIDYVNGVSLEEVKDVVKEITG